MQSFLEEVLFEIKKKQDTLEDIVFILPSKRAGTFLRNAIAKTATKTQFSPEIYSIETFIEKISGLNYATNTQQLFELYSTYLNVSKINPDNFFAFSKWGQTLLQDFNEIDRYLIDSKKLYSNLAAIQEINHWSVQTEKTQLMQDYLNFWNNLEELYSNFNAALIEKGIGHQGLVYRYACDNLSNYLEAEANKTHVFIGFNALNTAESQIIQTTLKTAKADVYWDTDYYFLNDHIHDAGYFIRKHKKDWPYYKDEGLKGLSEHYNTKKNIHITGVPKNVSQAKYVGSLLKKQKQENAESLKNTAVVLGDETLLNPILNAIPQDIDSVNITMGYPLQKTPLASLFTMFIDLYLHRDTQGWFHQNILSFLSHSYIHTLLNDIKTKDDITLISDTIKTKNWSYITSEKLQSILPNNSNLSLLFFKENISPEKFVKKCLEIVMALKTKFQDGDDSLALEYLYRFHSLFNQILALVQKHTFINDLKSLQSLYKELLSSETIDFQGDPLEGLQIMGMLESRNLDFETVIITSVNEGILPSGKSNNSFIPFDLKTNFGLPTYKEKDAVYTYHFYRLLQRAKNIHIIYNTEPDVLEGGEKSRLISQLLTDENQINDITEKVVTPAIRPTSKTIACIHKDDGLQQLIQNHANKGFSPTSLSNYVRNPIDFYKRNLLGIDSLLEVEETVAANTFGTIVHDTLEDLYQPFIGKLLSEDGLKTLKPKIPTLVKHHFAKSYMDGDITRGKNLIAYNVIVRYVENFIELEIREVKNHDIKILGLEENLKIQLNLPEVNFPVVLKGKLDRIDTKDGVIRIIDYKTGKVESKNVEIVDWSALTNEYEYSKAFQLLCYAYMYNSKHTISQIGAGIISFKNLKSGLLQFATKDRKGGRIKNTAITQETLDTFFMELKRLIIEICNPDIPFTEKEV